MSKKAKIVFLYTELAGYFLSCVDELVKNNVEVHIVRWQVNKEAPFDFKFHAAISVYNKNDLSLEQLLKTVKSINPDIIYCSGWIDKDYLKVCKEYKSRIPVIVGLDNQWRASLKDYLACLIRRFTVHNYFTHAWVPGKPQKEYALRLGFEDDKILKGFYSCDFNFFHNLYLENNSKKENHFPKRFIYVGRYYEFKGIKDLWQAFVEIQKEIPNEWELWCLGTGDIQPIEHEKIKHFGFVQPKDISKYISETGVFVLSSHFEPWGVVLHEFASAGFPIICSDEVGAATEFLNEEKNGFVFPSGNINSLKEKIKRIIALSDKQLIEMGRESTKLAAKITPEKWAKTLISLLS